MDTCHYIFVQTHRMYNTKSELKYKLWTLDDYDVSYRCRFISYKSYTSLTEDADNGGSCEWGGAGSIMRNLYYFPLIQL